MHDYFDSGDIAAASMEWTQATAEVSHRTSKKRVTSHFYGDGERASEGLVVGLVSGSADARGWTSVERCFL